MQFKGSPRLTLPDGNMVSIDQSPYIVGQYDSFCQLTIDDDDIAPVHLQFEYDNDQWFVRDMKSKTGVVVNQKNVPFGECLPVDHGDIVRMGHYKMTFALMPDALLTVDECEQINSDYAKLFSLQHNEKQDNARALIDLLQGKIEIVAGIAGIDSGIVTVVSANSDSLPHPDLVENHVNQPSDERIITASHSIETLSPLSDNPDDGQSDSAYSSGIGASEFDAQRSSDIADDAHLESMPAFPEAEGFKLSSRIMTPSPDVSRKEDAQVSSPAFDLQNRSVSGGVGEKSESQAFHQISDESSSETLTDFKSGFRLMPVDPTFGPVVVDHFPFSIGKKNHCDYVLKKSDVSRLHAMITNEAGDIYLTDNASTNGTFVGGYRLSPEEPIKLCDGDRISFAGYGFIVSF